MAPVPSTPTAADKQAEVVKLNLEIAGLHSAKDIAERAAREAEAAATDAKTRALGLETTLSELDQAWGDTARGMREFVAECRNTLQEVTCLMEVAAAEARKLSDRVGEICTEITKRKKELADLLESISKEAEEMSRKRKDLDIYHGRIVRAAAIHLPGQNVQI